MATMREAFLEAVKEFGQAAIPGNQSNEEILDYYAEAGHPEITDDDVPWCAAFVNAMLKRAGIQGTGQLSARSFLTWGKKMQHGNITDIVVLWRESPTSGLGHVGFVTAVIGDFVWILGGNQDNKVEIKPFPLARVLDFRSL